MRLLIFTNFYPYGSTDRFIEQELPFLVNAFNKITIIPLHKEPLINHGYTHPSIEISEPLLNFSISQKKALFIEGVFSFCNVSYFLKEFIAKKVYLNKNRFRNWLASTCTTRALLKKIRMNRILSHISNETILYFYWADKTSGIIPFLKKIIDNPLVVRFHGSDLYEEAKGGYQPYRVQLLSHLSIAVTISEMGEKYLHSKYPKVQLSTRIFRLGTFKPQGINLLNNQGVFHIVACSNIVKLKRLSLLLQSFKYLKIPIHCSIIGDGPLLEELKQQQNELQDTVHIQFMGRLSHSEIYNYYSTNSIDVFVNVSESEGIPVSIMEALSFGIPVIATNVGGTSEIVDDSVGFLIPKDITAEQLASYISKFRNLASSEISDLRQKAVKRWGDKYNAEKNYNNFTLFLKSLCKGN